MTKAAKPSGPATVVALLGAGCAVAAASVMAYICWRLAMGTHGMGDMLVWLEAARWWLSGHALYSYATDLGYGFTYPPIAIAFFTPWTWPPEHLVKVVWTVLNLVFVGAIVFVILWAYRPHRMTRQVALGAAGFALMASTLPVQASFMNGQFNIFLCLLVLIDAVLVSGKASGVLTGAAAALKLTPGLFLPFYWIAGRRVTAGVATATLLGLTALGWLILPAESSTYWLGAVWDTGRVGDVALLGNHSIMGVAARGGLSGPWRLATWAACSVAITVVAMGRARTHVREADLPAAATVIGLATLLVTPVSWPHHEIWLSIGVLLLLAARDWTRRIVGLCLLLVLWQWSVVDGLAATLGLRTMLSLFLSVAMVVLCVAGFGRRQTGARGARP